MVIFQIIQPNNIKLNKYTFFNFINSKLGYANAQRVYMAKHVGKGAAWKTQE
jgi:hypothetical protein